MELFGKRLKELRLEKGLTQEELGKELHVTKVSICCYEKGKRTPTLDTLWDIVHFFNVSFNDLLGQDYYIEDMNTRYGGMVAKEELVLLEEIRKYDSLYRKLIENPKKYLDYIEKKLR